MTQIVKINKNKINSKERIKIINYKCLEVQQHLPVKEIYGIPMMIKKLNNL